MGVSPRRINEIVNGKRAVTTDTAILMLKFFGTSEEFWMNLQSHYEMGIQRRVSRDQFADVAPRQVT